MLHVRTAGRSPVKMTARVRRWRSSSRTGLASLPVRFEECREVAIYETADPEVIVVEYELAGTVTTTGRRTAAPFIGVLRVRAGQAELTAG